MRIGMEKSPLLGDSVTSRTISSSDSEEKLSRVHSLIVTLAILVTELCERLTFYSLTGNMVIYCTNRLDFRSGDAIQINLIFTGVVYFVPVFGGWIADTISGRFNTIFASGMIYFLGSSMLTVSAYDFGASLGKQHALSTIDKRAFFGIGLALVAIGTGGIKSNVSPFGAQQLESLGDKAVRSFFNWFYWFINLGAAIAYSAVVYVQQEVSFFYGFLIPTLSIFLGILTFFAPRSVYVHHEPGGSAFTDLFRVFLCAIRKRRQSIFRYRSMLDYARLSNGGDFTDDQVDAVIKVARILPIFLFVIIFWTIYFQMQSTYLLQGERMNLSLGNFQVPAASLNLFNTIVILASAPIVDRLIFPAIQWCTGKVPSMLQRMGFGMLCAAASVAIAGGVEMYRKADLNANGGFPQVVANKTFNASSITIFYQVPQFVFVGLGEVFTSISGLEFAFAESPAILRSVVMGMFLITNGLGSFLGSALVSIVNASTYADQWLPDEINVGHLEYFCFLLTALMLFNFLLYIFVARWYEKSKFKRHLRPLCVKYTRMDDSGVVDGLPSD